MKKSIIIGLTALTIVASCGSLTAQAAGKNITRQPVVKQNVIVSKNVNKNCIPKNMQGKFSSVIIKGQGNFKCEDIIWNGNCPTFPGNNGDGNGNNGGNGNENNGGNNGNGGSTDDDSTQDTYAKKVVDLVNKERAKEGLSPLAMDENIGSAANVRAKEIQTNFSHTRPNGDDFSTALKEAGVSYRGTGENIAYGQKTPEEVVKSWMNSKGHRANIMNKNYTKIGVGHLKNAKGTSYWVQLFTY